MLPPVQTEASLDPAFITVARAAKALRINPRKLRRAVYEGALPGYRIGAGRTVYLEPAELRRWIRSHRVRPASAAARAHVQHRLDELKRREETRR